MLNVLYILEALRLNYIMPGYLRSSLRCVRWDKCKYCPRLGSKYFLQPIESLVIQENVCVVLFL